MKYLIALLIILALYLDLVAQETCYTPAQVAPVKAMSNPDPLNGDYCVTVYVEVDHDIVLDKGAQGSRAYVDGLLQEVATLYAAQGITLNFDLKYWDTPSPYSSSSSSGMLRQFRDQTAAGHSGDVAHLISYRASGGIAYVDAICSASFGHAFSSIRSTYANYPTYSWSVEVFAHELGHNLGSPHTQSCVWNNNQTAIDGCSPFGTEGGCADPGLPSGGGTIMSYCHLNSAVGINFLKGFHDQPLAVIKNRIANAQCAECVDDPDDPEPEVCNENQIIVELQLDNYAKETSWAVIDADGATVGASEPFGKLDMNTYHSDTLCLPDGCYTFVITDIDGLGGYGCSEGMYIVNSEQGEVSSGQNFTNEETTNFCLGVAPPDGECDNVAIRADSLIDYANQSRSPWAIVTDIEGGVTVEGNNWRALPYTYNITPNTVLTFEALIETVGEIQGVALLDNIRSIYPDRSFRFGGTQNWGIAIEQIIIGEWVNVTIPIGQYFTGEVTHVVLINDDDHRAVVKTGWRNMEICESGQAGLKMGFAEPQGAAKDEAWSDNRTIEGYDIARRAKERRPHPNPTTDTLILPLETMWHLYGVNGRLIDEGWGSKVDLSLLPTGFYLLHDGTTTHKVVKK